VSVKDRDSELLKRETSRVITGATPGAATEFATDGFAVQGEKGEKNS
jgi:hypothetical protein